jgi:hypothetical protein
MMPPWGPESKAMARRCQNTACGFVEERFSAGAPQGTSEKPEASTVRAPKTITLMDLFMDIMRPAGSANAQNSRMSSEAERSGKA